MTQTQTQQSQTDFAQHVLKRCLEEGAESAQVMQSSSDLFEINFDNCEVDLIRTTHNSNTTLTLFSQGKKSSASFNGTDDVNLTAALQTAKESMDASLPDPSNHVAVSKSTDFGSKGSQEPQRETMVKGINDYIKEMKESPKIIAGGIYSFTRQNVVFTNSSDVLHQENRGYYQLSLSITGKDGPETTSMNFTGLGSYTPIEHFLSLENLQETIGDSLNSFNPKSIPEKFTGDLIFTPKSISSLTNCLLGSLSGYELMSGTTPYKDKQGSKIASPSLTLRNEPLNESFPYGSSFDSFGIPTQNIELIKNGVLNDYFIDYFCSQKLNQAQTAGATNLIIDSGDTPLEEIISSTKRGVLMTRFSGGQPNKNLDFSGVAKTAFYIEDGEIRYPLIETMVSGNFSELIQNINAISKETFNNGSSISPYISMSGATFSSE